VSEIEGKLGGILAKTKSADILIDKMVKETQEWLRTVSEIFFLRMGLKNSSKENELVRIHLAAFLLCFPFRKA